jgi:hypothetical protein
MIEFNFETCGLPFFFFPFLLFTALFFPFFFFHRVHLLVDG